MADTGACWVTEGGGGCARDVSAVCSDTAGEGEQQDTSSELVAEGGGGPNCGSGDDLVEGGAWLVVLYLLALARRWGPVGLALLWANAAAAVDAQALQGADGGRFASLTEPWRTAPWSVRAALTTSYARRVVVLRSSSDTQVVLDRLWTHELGASIAAGSYARLGVSAPYHGPYSFQDEPNGITRGDIALWATIHLSPEEKAVQRTWTVAADVPSAVQDQMLGDPGAVRGTLAASRTLSDPFRVAWQLGARLQQVTELPGVSWGRRVEGGLGVDWAAWPTRGFTAELLASGPLKDGSGARSAWPVEAMVTARQQTGRSWVRLGAGVGLTAGIGAPAWRLSLAVYGEDIGTSDRDQDGIVDLRDACRDEPEDFDDYRDRDGCPEPDNDQDGFLDVDDECPMEAEVFNDYRDDDGCPDAMATLRLTVRSATGGIESAQVLINNEPLTVIPDEAAVVRLPEGWLDLSVSADGHIGYDTELPLMASKDLTVTLEPITWGRLDLTVTTPEGERIPGARLSTGEPLSGPLRMPAGPRELTVQADGYQPRTLDVEIPPDETAAMTVALSPSGPWLEDTRLRLTDPIAFALDSATLTEEARRVVSELADWLASHPEVRLLRVEGLADALGSPAYNHRLSVARARAVSDGLIAAGVDRARLEPIGTGEALASPGQTRDDDRSVRFLVIVWDAEMGERPADDAATLSEK